MNQAKLAAMAEPKAAIAAPVRIADILAFAERMADASGEILRRHFREDLRFDDKADLTPVTAADREVETMMREMIGAQYPAHGIVGEEFGPVREDAETVWVLDPIDGTGGFITGKPLFGTLIGCLQHGLPVAGVIDHPALNERGVGGQGRPATFNGRAARARPRARVSEAMLYATTPRMFAGADAYAFDALSEAVKAVQFGADCYAYGLLASGFVDLVVEAKMKPSDYCALAPVVEAAGGVMSDWEGRPLGLKSDGRVIAAGDARVHSAALKILATGRELGQGG
jgi:inositol-phosphate phosphatase/L-galactose 1-phosphate phosphatase/histidinol-phosphatase